MNFDVTKFCNPKPSFQNSRPVSGNGRNEYAHRGGRFLGGKHGKQIVMQCHIVMILMCVNLCNDKRNDEWLDDKRFIIPVYIKNVKWRPEP